MAFEAMPFPDGCQLGSGASALSASQTPPPAAPMKILQSFARHVGEIASAVVRPEKNTPTEPPVDSDATCAEAGTPLGPSSCQLVALPPGRRLIAAAACAAASCSAAPMTAAGYARLSYASCAAPSVDAGSPPSATFDSAVLNKSRSKLRKCGTRRGCCRVGVFRNALPNTSSDAIADSDTTPAARRLCFVPGRRM